jgi:tRNA (cmo5U34)-methyltransferase
MEDHRSPFENSALVASYAEDAVRKVPGLRDLHRMAVLLLAKRTPKATKVLVVGAGGGLELTAMATAQPDWKS